MKLCGLGIAFGFILLVGLLNISRCDSLEKSSNQSDTLQKWMKMDKKLKETVQSLIKKLMPTILESSSRVNLTSQCSSHMFQLVSGLRNLKKWAFSFADSSSKSIDGALSSSITNFGSYDQCLETVVPNSRNKDAILFRGQYCKVRLYPPLPPKSKRYKLFDRLEELRNFTGTETVKVITTRAHLFYFFPITMGLCIPSSCTENDLHQILNVAIEDYYLNAKVAYCEVLKEKSEFRSIQIFSITCCSVLGFFVLIGTISEMCFGIQQEIKLFRVLNCFSVKNNFKKLIDTKPASEKFRCLHGIRFLSITWVIFGHAYFFPAWYMTYYRTLTRVQNIASEPFAQTIINSSMVTDSFFFMSGLLVCYLTIKHVKLDEKKFNILQFVIHRLWRIAPVYYFILLFTFLVPLMGSGPVFKQTMDDAITPCFTYWWRNLLFINNYSDMNNTCMMHNWYVACDTQLYLASLLVLYPYFKSEKLGLIINVMIILVSIIYTGFMVIYWGMPTFTILMIFRDPEDLNLGFKYIYANAITRSGPYFIGTLVGYILVTRPDIKIPKVFQKIGWCLATISTSLVLYSSAIWLNVRMPNKIEVIMYASLYNVAFTAGIAWMTFCCISGRGGFINRILSWKAWMPFSKLTFTIYIVQPIFQIAYISVFRSPQEYSHMDFIVQAFGFLSISTLLALIVNLLVESPFMALEKLLFKREQKNTDDASKDKDLAFYNEANFNNSTYASYGADTSIDNHAFDTKE